MADYCTVTQVKTRLDISSAGYDSLLGELATAASRWVDRYCRLPVDGFAQATSATRYYEDDAVIGSTLILDVPVISVSSIVNGNGATVAASSYRLLPRNEAPYWRIRLLSGYSWLWTTDGEIQVTGLWGYSTTAPEPVQEATAMLAAWMFKRYQSALQDATVNVDLGELTYSESIPKQVRALLQPYLNLGRVI